MLGCNSNNLKKTSVGKKNVRRRSSVPVQASAPLCDLAFYARSQGGSDGDKEMQPASASDGRWCDFSFHRRSRAGGRYDEKVAATRRNMACDLRASTRTA